MFFSFSFFSFLCHCIARQEEKLMQMAVLIEAELEAEEAVDLYNISKNTA